MASLRSESVSELSSEQVTSKLNHAQMGMYLMYLGAVVGSSGFISFNVTASLIRRDTVPDAESLIQIVLSVSCLLVVLPAHA